jgi:hypothetical protein
MCIPAIIDYRSRVRIDGAPEIEDGQVVRVWKDVGREVQDVI